MKPPYVPPRIPSPKERAEQRGRLIKAAIWFTVALPVFFLVMAYGYSDQAPAVFRDFTMRLDGAFGSPVWEILKRISGR